MAPDRSRARRVPAEVRSLGEMSKPTPDPEADPEPDARFFPYGIDGRWSPLFTVLSVGEADGVTLLDDGGVPTFRATFGRWSVETPIANIDHTEVSGPHRWWTSVGMRLSFADDGLTFGTNHERGLCVAFVERIPKVIGLRDHSAVWVSVADPEGLADALAGSTDPDSADDADDDAG